MAGNTLAERSACLAEARRRGYSEAAIAEFLADSPGDECRLLTALGTPTLAASMPYDPSNPYVLQAIAAGVPESSIRNFLLREPGDYARILSAVSYGGVIMPPGSGPAAPRASGWAANPSGGVPSAVMPPASYAPPSASVVAAPGGVLLPASVTAAAPPMLAGLGGNTLLLLVAAAVVVYLMVNR
jgi:hypothetical protein